MLQDIGFFDGGFFAAHIHHEDQIGQAGHVAHTAETEFEFFHFAVEQQAFFLGQLIERAFFALALQQLHGFQATAHGPPVGQRAAEPTLVDIGHPAAVRFGSDGFLRLALGADKQDRAAIGDGVAHHSYRSHR